MRKRKRGTEKGETLIHISIWSSKYKLKTKNDVSFFKNAAIINSRIIPKKELALQKSLDEENSNKHTPSELHNNPTVSCNRLSECQDSNEKAILDMYNSNQDTKLIINAEKEAEEHSCLAENNMSPELLKYRNPFVKRVSELTTSPSVLSNGNCRRRGRNLMRIRRTVVDENVIVESKYFSKQDDENPNVFELANKRIEDDISKNMECNVIIPETLEPETNDIIYDTRANQEQLEKNRRVKDDVLKNMECNQIIPETSDSCDTGANEEQLEMLSIAEIANSIKDIDDSILSDQNEYLIYTCQDVSEKSYSKYSTTETSHSTTIDKDYVLDKFFSNSNTEAANDSINYENANSLQDNLSKCLNIKDSHVSLRKKEILKKRSSENLVNIDLHE